MTELSLCTGLLKLYLQKNDPFGEPLRVRAIVAKNEPNVISDNQLFIQNEKEANINFVLSCLSICLCTGKTFSVKYL
jgi:hypothetical protein